MSSPEVLRGDRADLDLRAARLVENAIEQCAATQPQVVLGVVGGRRGREDRGRGGSPSYRRAAQAAGPCCWYLARVLQQPEV